MNSQPEPGSPRAKTIDEFARDWRIGRTTVYQLASLGKLRLTKIGKATRILLEDERRFASTLKQTTQSTGQANKS